jgi:hypothetical protein
VRLAVFATLLSVFAITGCYSPKVQSGGFACAATDNPPCPSGFFCVNGLCIDHPGGGGGGGGGGGLSDDLAMSMMPGDMTMSTNADMSKPPADLAMGPADMSCLPYPYQCNSDPTCCAKCCVGGCALAGNCALF